MGGHVIEWCMMATVLRAAKNKSGAYSNVELLIAELKKCLAAEYTRGMQDALEQISKITLVKPDVLDIARNSQTIDLNGRRKRTPWGAAKPLVQRALSSGAKSIRDIQNVARTEVEKSLSYQTIRLELERGKRQKRYHKNKEGWSIIVAS